MSEAMAGELEHMSLAIEEARKCESEDGRAHPRVGAVIVKDGAVVASAYRGQEDPGEHAEYTVMERLLPDVGLAGATLYTTLEPCTSRSPGKVPCADRIIERKIAAVRIGMLDPNPLISGRGFRRLRGANIETTMFSPKLMPEIEEMNREFSRAHERGGAAEDTGEIPAERLAKSLDEWYRDTNRIYWNSNFRKDLSSLMCHLVEVVGGASLLASGKTKVGLDPELSVPKAIAWWFAMCGKAGVKSVADLIWDKFPGVCPYCESRPHAPDLCAERKAASPGPDWERLAEMAAANHAPSRLSDWQRTFNDIYPVQQTETYAPTFARLAEELGELAEAVRVFPAEPGYFLSEAADVFAWLMHVQNMRDSQHRATSSERGIALEITYAGLYGDSCADCGQQVCTCPPILPRTVGRIAHDVPPARGGFGESGRFMTTEKAVRMFQDWS